MDLFLQFLAAKWYLVGPWLVLIVMLIVLEQRRGGSSVSPAQLTDLVNREQGVVLDVRDAKDFRAGHIVDSIHIPHAKVPQQLGDLEKYRERPIVVVCKMGQSAGTVCRALKQGGFQRVYKLGGGLAEWQGSQLPLVKS
jgi:rhodanese-related sulfurtransferase